MPESFTKSLLCELADFFRRMGPVIVGIGAFFGPIWFIFDEAVNEWLEMPAKIATIEQRLGAVPPVPFVEFQQATHMWPEILRPGQIVRVTYVLRWNKHCLTTVDRRFQHVDSNATDERLTIRERAIVAPLTTEFELFTVRFRLPEDIPVGFYAYRPIFYCEGMPSVQAPAAFFEVKAA